MLSNLESAVLLARMKSKILACISQMVFSKRENSLTKFEPLIPSRE